MADKHVADRETDKQTDITAYPCHSSCWMCK